MIDVAEIVTYRPGLSLLILRSEQPICSLFIRELGHRSTRQIGDVAARGGTARP
jgi:hypothetical protein